MIRYALRRIVAHSEYVTYMDLGQDLGQDLLSDVCQSACARGARAVLACSPVARPANSRRAVCVHVVYTLLAEENRRRVLRRAICLCGAVACSAFV